jgi:hypothetical protein
MCSDYEIQPIYVVINHTTGNTLFFIAQQPLVDQGLLIIEASRSNSDTPHSVGLLWKRDQLCAQTSI